MENEYFCNMVVVIASVEQCHGICHRNISLKASRLLFMLKKRKRDIYFLLRNAYVQSRLLLNPALPALLRSCCSVRAVVHLPGHIPSTHRAPRGFHLLEQVQVIPNTPLIAEHSDQKQRWFCPCNIFQYDIH